MKLFSPLSLPVCATAMMLLLTCAGPARAQKATEVNVVNTPTVKLVPPSTPLPVRDVNDGRQPFTDNLISGVKNSFTVPSGKRLVVEFVSGAGSIPQGHKFTEVALLFTAALNGGLVANVLHQFSPELRGTVQTSILRDTYGVSQQARFCVEPNGIVGLELRSDTAGSFSVVVSGYLVDVL